LVRHWRHARRQPTIPTWPIGVTALASAANGIPTGGADRVHTDQERARPGRDETFAAAVELASAGATTFKRQARRYSLCAADADDAYQRSLEILLTKAPTSDRGELRAWLHTVIKHEALALRRQRERALGAPDSSADGDRAETSPSLDEQASGRERVSQTAEALAHLRTAEIQCLLLKALGYSYSEIAERTGYSWTKVNRSLTEGRKRFIERFGEIASGARCTDFETLLSASSDGETSELEDRRLRVHLRRCPSCRAALRDYRATPARLAELLPPGVLLPVMEQGAWWSRVGDWLSAGGGDRAGMLAARLQQSAEAIGAHKAAAVVASTAALAGGASVHEHAAHHPSHHRTRAADVVTAPAPERVSPPAPIVQEKPETVVETPAPRSEPQDRKPIEAANAEPAGEFTPEASAPAAPAPAQAPAAETARAARSAPAAAGQEFVP
jgi:RNA polymerase sigma factor (sigma-70 family)